MPNEYVGNLHVHTVYSDGSGSHNQVAAAALEAGLDFVVVTDHNVLVGGLDGYRHRQGRRVLLVTAEEIHDPNRQPQRNHLLAYEVGRELAPLAAEPQRLIDGVRAEEGLAFLAHPYERAAPRFGEGDYSWVSWEVEGFTGLEIWNFMSEFKSLLTSWPAALSYAYQPHRIASGPFPETLDRWDQLLAAGKRVVAIGGSDAHARLVRKGPLRRTIFPYEFLFRAVNTHVLTDEALTGEVELDRRRLFLALRRGRCFVGYDLPASTRGFRFTATSDRGTALMGETVTAQFGATFQIRTPRRCRLRLLRDGELINEWLDRDQAVHTAQRAGAYRVEAHLQFAGETRTWILSNPIYVKVGATAAP